MTSDPTSAKRPVPVTDWAVTGEADANECFAAVHSDTAAPKRFCRVRNTTTGAEPIVSARRTEARALH